jgi:hypothetical protein
MSAVSEGVSFSFRLPNASPPMTSGRRLMARPHRGEELAEASDRFHEAELGVGQDGGGKTPPRLRNR